MSKSALRSAICRNVRDGAYLPPALRRGHEIVRPTAGGTVAVIGASRPLSNNLGALVLQAINR